MAVKTFQVTLTGGTDAVLPAGDIFCKFVRFTNNASNAMALGDATLQPIKLAAAAAYEQDWSGPGLLNIRGWYVKGTAADKLDVIYDTGAQ